MINIYDLIDEWELHKDPAAIRKFTRHELELFLEKIEELYKNNPSPKIGSCNMGVRDTLSLLSSPKGRLKSLSSPVLLSEKVWIPDPLFGAIAPSAAEVWKKLPESGSTFLIDSPAIQTNWKPIVDVSPSERKSTLRNTLLTYVGSILSLRSLHDIGAIEFYSWEKILAPQLDPVAHPRNIDLGYTWSLHADE